MGSPWSPNIPERESGVEAALAGDAARARAIDAREVEPAFGALADRLAEGALDEREQVAASLAELRRLGRTLVVATPIAFTVGLSLLSGCWLLLGYQRRIRRQALSDALTGLPNRTLLRDRTNQAIRQADRELVPAALALIDLDRFKEVNDTLGHHYGDQLLVQVGERLRGALRAVDTVARLGGDEFAVLLPTIASAEGAVVVVRKLQDALGGSFVLEGLSLDVEASIGVALYPEHGNDPDELLQHADIAMYAAKQTHAGFMLFDPKLDQHSPRRLALLGELRRAIDSEQLVLHYQPKVDAHSGRVLGVEALVRWQHPQHGLLPPGEFIPLAERTGLIGPLTHYVLDAALRQCRAWQQTGRELTVAVNVSARRLLDPGFPDEVAGLLARWDAPARLLVVEITESAIMTDPAHALQVLDRLNQLGVQVSIDDFGTGYSSMAHLKSLPVHELKVDRSFVSQMTSNASDAVIVRSTVDLGRNLGLRVVAEGVEDPATVQELEALGCDAIQGYYISRPVAPDELIRWRDLPVTGLTRLRSGVADNRVRPVRRLQTGHLLPGQRHLHRRDRVVDVARPGRPHDRRAHHRLAEQPRQRDLSRWHVTLAGDRADHVDDVEVGVVVHRVGERVAAGPDRVPLATPLAGAGQQPARQRAPRDHAHPLVQAERDHLPLLLPVDQVVVVLHRHEPGPARLLGGVLGLRELPGVHAGGPDVARLTGPNHVVQRLHGLRDRRLVVPTVDLIEVDVVGAQPAQRRVDAGEDVLAGQSLVVGTRPRREVDLGGEHVVLAVREELGEQPAGDLLAHAV
jgi:diguanylate cyclase